MSQLFHLVVDVIEEDSELIAQSDAFRIYQSHSGISDYRLLLEFTQHLQVAFPDCEIAAYETNQNIEIAITHQNETILISFCIKDWIEGKTAHIHYYWMNLHDSEMIDATLDFFVHEELFRQIEKGAKEYIGTLNKYRLYIVSGKGWEK